MTLEDHKRIGQKLFEMHNDIVHMICELSPSVRKTELKYLHKVDINLCEARSLLENIMFAHHPKEADIKTYYPGAKKC
jgi:hypothetical protein